MGISSSAAGAPVVPISALDFGAPGNLTPRALSNNPLIPRRPLAASPTHEGGAMDIPSHSRRHPRALEPHRVYTARYPGPWNSPMRTPFTKRIAANRRIYLTASPGRQLDGLIALSDEEDDEEMMNAEWELVKNINVHSEPHAPRRTRTRHGNRYGDNDVFEDAVEPLAHESDVSLSDQEYLPDTAKSIPSEDSDSSNDGRPGSPVHVKGKGKGKTVNVPKRGRATIQDAAAAALSGISDSGLDDTLIQPPKGRPTKEAAELFREFGQATRERAQALATRHGVNLATVMRHAGFGTVQGTRAPSDFNTFKKLWAAQTLAETGGAFTFTIICSKG